MYNVEVKIRKNNRVQRKMCWRKERFDDHKKGDDIWWVLGYGNGVLIQEIFVSVEPAKGIVTGKRGWLVWLIYNYEKREEAGWYNRLSQAKSAAEEKLYMYYEAILKSIPR